MHSIWTFWSSPSPHSPPPILASKSGTNTLVKKGRYREAEQRGGGGLQIMMPWLRSSCFGRVVLQEPGWLLSPVLLISTLAERFCQAAPLEGLIRTDHLVLVIFSIATRWRVPVMKQSGSLKRLAQLSDWRDSPPTRGSRASINVAFWGRMRRWMAIRTSDL